MEQANPAVWRLARHLLELHADRSEHATLITFGKLRLHLSKLVGVAGFHSLFARALALTKRETGWLEAVRVQADGTLQGFSEAAQEQNAETIAEGSTALLMQMLNLLIIFVGEALTLLLVGQIWPEIQMERELVHREGGSDE